MPEEPRPPRVVPSEAPTPFTPSRLRYFVTVAEEGQITLAAEKLHVAQPALSKAIARLESDLGVKLLKRHARGVTLTAAGEAFLPKAQVGHRPLGDEDSSDATEGHERHPLILGMGRRPGPCGHISGCADSPARR